MFNLSAAISSLVASDSKRDGNKQKQRVVKKQVVTKPAKDEIKWNRNIAKKRNVEGKPYIGIQNKNKSLKSDQQTGKN